MNLDETKYYGINEEDDFSGSFYVEDYLTQSIQERKGTFLVNKKQRVDIYIKECCGNEPHIHLRDSKGNICRIKLRKNEYQRDSYEKNGKGHCLDKDEIEAFNNYMKSTVPGSITNNNKNGITQWERLSLDWNTAWSGNNNGNAGLVDISAGIPNYSVIVEPKK